MSAAKKWAGIPLLGFDVESSGVSVWDDRIVTASIVAYKPATGRHEIREWLINPQVDIPAGATEVHGITTDHAREHGVDPGQALLEIVGTIVFWLSRGVPLAVMNAAFDITMLEVECRRHHVEGLVARLGRYSIKPILDPFVLDKHAEPYRKGGRKLVNLCEKYGVDLPADQAHNSTADTLATCQLVGAVLDWWPQRFRSFTLDTLHQLQMGWRREQMDSLREYFDRSGKEHDGCDPGWPLLTPPAGVVPGVSTAVA